MTRPIIFIIAVLTLAALWLTPWASLGMAPFSAHMVVHMGIVAVAAPLLALGVAGSALDPVARLPALFPPVPVSLVEFIVVWAWHTPALHHAARQPGLASLAEQGMFFLAGLWLWLAVVGGTGDERRGRAGSGVLALLLTSMHMTLLGVLLALAPRPLFAHDTADATHALDALAALADQQLGGAIMLLIGGVAYLAGGLWLTAGLLRRVDYRQRART
ncbi:MAG: cytochrome c oxidase assembly protein [Candidatus Binatia bacterium]